MTKLPEPDLEFDNGVEAHSPEQLKKILAELTAALAEKEAEITKLRDIAQKQMDLWVADGVTIMTLRKSIAELVRLEPYVHGLGKGILREIQSLDEAPQKPKDATGLVIALGKITDSHKFNCASLKPYEVHAIAFGAIDDYLADPKAATAEDMEIYRSIAENYFKTVERIETKKLTTEQVSDWLKWAREPTVVVNGLWVNPHKLCEFVEQWAQEQFKGKS